MDPRYDEVRVFLQDILRDFDTQEAVIAAVNRCVQCFVLCGYDSLQSVVDDCENIDPDDLHLSLFGIRPDLIAIVYDAIRNMRKPAVDQVPGSSE